MKRQVEYALGVIVTLAIAFGGGWYIFLYSPASCIDQTQNQGEEGVDCGGPCSTICKPPRVDAVWSRAVKVADGVYHAVALVKNPLSNAYGSHLNYALSLYDEGNILVAERKGSFDVAPGETRAIFEPNVVTGSRIPVRAFMVIEGGNWAKADPVQNPITIVTQNLDQEKLRLDATIENTTAAPITGIIADALLYNAQNILIAASETTLPSLAGRDRHDLTFTWGLPFPESVARADIEVRSDATHP